MDIEAIVGHYEGVQSEPMMKAMLVMMVICIATLCALWLAVGWHALTEARRKGVASVSELSFHD